MLKNLSGTELEKFRSLSFHHSKSIPLLVSSQLLRSRDLGQIDLARMVKDKDGWLLEIAEVKSSEVGEEMMMRFQKKRLISAQVFLSGIFGARTKLLRLIGQNLEH